MNDISIRQVGWLDLVAHWEKVESLLDAAMPVSLQRYQPIDVLAMCIQGAPLTQAWMIGEGNELLAVMVTQVIQYPRRRGLMIFSLSGARMDEWFEKADELITTYAKHMGCDHIQAEGRRGWERVLGLEPRATFLVKDLMNNEIAPNGGAQSASSISDGGE
jgi:hypothetical protein